jgi:hypothetical protein
MAEQLLIGGGVSEHQPGNGERLGRAGDRGVGLAAAGPQQGHPHVGDLAVDEGPDQVHREGVIVSCPVLGAPDGRVAVRQGCQAAAGAAVLVQEDDADAVPERPVHASPISHRYSPNGELAAHDDTELRSGR